MGEPLTEERGEEVAGEGFDGPEDTPAVEPRPRPEKCSIVSRDARLLPGDHLVAHRDDANPREHRLERGAGHAGQDENGGGVPARVVNRCDRNRGRRPDDRRSHHPNVCWRVEERVQSRDLDGRKRGERSGVCDQDDQLASGGDSGGEDVDETQGRQGAKF